MKFTGTVVSKWVDIFSDDGDGWVYAETLQEDECLIRIDTHEFSDNKLPNVGDVVEIEKQGMFWIQARVIHTVATNWKKDGF